VTGLLFSLVSLVLSSWPKYSHVNSITCDRVVVSVVYLVLSSWPKYSHVNSITCDRVVVFCCFSGSVLMA
jgi:hypothetical protein